ncbi:hypothetical protein MMPV_009572 [Pyropia vietnamensis]
MDWDRGAVYYSYQAQEQSRSGDRSAVTTGGGGGSSGGSGGGGSAGGTGSAAAISGLAAQRRFSAFLLGFTDARSAFPYRERLRAAALAGAAAIDASLDDLLHFDAPLAAALRARPTELLPRLERAATLAAALLAHNITLPAVAGGGGVGGAAARAYGAGVDDEAARERAAELERIGMQVVLGSGERGRPIRELQAVHVSRLVRVSGIVIAASKTTCKATRVRLQCRHCRNETGVEVKPGLGGFVLPRFCRAERPDAGAGGDDACPLDPYVVVPDASSYVDAQRLKLQELPEQVPTGEMPRSIELAVDRRLTDLAAPGVRISVLGVYSVYNAASGGAAVRAARGGASSAVRSPYVRVVGLDVEDAAGYSGGRTVSAFGIDEEEAMLALSRTPGLYDRLARSVAPEIFGHEDIKRAIAALLFGGAPDKRLPDGMQLRGDINVLLLGDPSTAKSQLLKFVERAAPVSVYTSGKGSSAAGLTASVVRDSGHGEFHLEGGAMVLADGGVVCIDEFDKMDARDRVAIHEAMEQQTISIAKAGITAVLNARAAVLAAANPAFGRYDDTRSSAENIEFQSTILSRFDLIFIVRDVRDDARDRAIANHVMGLHMRGGGVGGGGDGPHGAGLLASADALAVATSTETAASRGGRPGRNGDGTGGAAGGTGGHAHSGGGSGSGGGGGGGGGGGVDGSAISAADHIDIETLQRYVAYARSRSAPRLSAEAAALLRNTYVSIREQVRARELGDDPDGNGGERTVPITVRQLEAIVRIAEALAKMTLSPVASERHVAEAIRLFKVATLDSASAGAIQSAEGALRPEVRLEVQRVEEALRRRLAIGSMAAERRLLDYFRGEAYSDFAVRQALVIMVRRGELEWRRQRKYVYRAR